MSAAERVPTHIREEGIRRAAESYPGGGARDFIDRGMAVEWFAQGADFNRLPLPADGCQCEWHTQDAGGGHTEILQECNPACPEHSEHVWNPRSGSWEHADAAPRLSVIREMHSPVAGEHDGLPIPDEGAFSDPGPYCSACSTPRDPVPWPCDTSRAVDGWDPKVEGRRRAELNKQRFSGASEDL